MNRKILVSIVSGVIAAVLAVGASTELLSPVSAAEEAMAVFGAQTSEEQAVPEEQGDTETQAVSETEAVPEMQELPEEPAVPEIPAASEPLAVAVEAVACEQALVTADVRGLADGEVVEVWQCPLVKDTFVSSPYGMRLHPVYGYYKMHNGVDLRSKYGDHIVAARSGVVITAKYSSSGGYYVEIDHGDGFVTQYMHMSKYIVKVGQEVTAGELLGYVGNTGVSTSAHLHFGMKYEGSHVDPEDYMEF